MEDAGIIEGSRFIVKPRALGLKICAFIGVVLDNAHQYKSVVKELEKFRKSRNAILLQAIMPFF